MKKITKFSIFSLAILGVISLLSIGCKKSSDNNNNNPPLTTITDIDGNVYHTVTIGTQVWMVENLKTTKYNDGSSIPLVPVDSVWVKLSTPAYCWYDNNIEYKNTYGALYNWYTIQTGKLCPAGWHIPTEADLNTLATYLGGPSVAGGKLKETGTSHWESPNTAATNESGFTAYAGGLRTVDRSEWFGHMVYSCYYTGLGSDGSWWTTSYNETTHNCICLDLVYDYGYMDSSGFFAGDGFQKRRGLSVRCIKN